MMLEAVDPQHQSLFCVCNIVDIQGYRLRLHLTGYSEIFDFWVNADSLDIFPPGWSAPIDISKFFQYPIEFELVWIYFNSVC